LNCPRFIICSRNGAEKAIRTTYALASREAESPQERDWHIEAIFLNPDESSSFATELLLCIARIFCFAYLVGQRSSDEHPAFRAMGLFVDVDRYANVETTCDPSRNFSHSTTLFPTES
jgi:hypothetical protein